MTKKPSGVEQKAGEIFKVERMRWCFLNWLGLLSLCPIFASAEFDRALEPFFENHCFECHDDVTAKAGLDLFSLGPDLNDPAVSAKWEQLYDRVRLGEMPPEEQPRPSAQELAVFEQILAPKLTDAHAAEKGTVLRRLNRQEYENTLNDLFGTNLDLVSLLPEDGKSHEFDNVGKALSISKVQMQRYLEGIEAVLDAAITKTIAKPESTIKQASYAEGRDSPKFIGKNWLKLDDGAVVFFRDQNYPSGTLREANVSKAGYYTVRITGYAYQSDEPITFVVNGDTYQRGAEKPTYGYFSMQPGPPRTVEFKTWIGDRYMLQIKPQGISDRNQLRNMKLEDYRGPGLAIQKVEIEGPIIEEFPTRGHELLFAGLNREEIMPRNPKDRLRDRYVPKYVLKLADPSTEIGPVLQRIATAAFRRPVTSEGVAPYLDLFRSELELGSSNEEAFLTAVKAIFCSPGFLYLRERPGLLDDYALAARLSFAFARATPDPELLQRAARGQLASNSQVILQQVDRLLNDSRFERFIVDFTNAWLNLRDMDFTSPDRNLFPEFDAYLQYSMVQETRGYLRELIARNLSASHLVKSDFAMVNERLATHYELPPVPGPEVRPVSLPPDSVRGGFLSQGSVLKVSANGTNTSPVVRGVWVLERILGVTPAPPPAGIPGVEPDIRGATTLRELLDKHRDSVSCQSCHQKIDPPGFALENFNPVGGHRVFFRSLGVGERIHADAHYNSVRYRKGPPVDASGVLPDGREFANYREFRDLLAADEAQLAKTFTKKLLTFLTGRELGFSDRPEIERIVQEASAKGYGIRDLIELSVLSPIFLQK